MPKHESTVTGTFTCGKCGGAVQVPHGEPDDTPIVCPECGADLGTFGQMKDLMKEETKKLALKMAKTSFRSIKRNLKR